MPNLTTKLEAVNSMLAHIGESPVNSITSLETLPVSAVTAASTLEEISRAVQTEGWHFNTEVNVVYTPVASGEILVADDILELDPIDKSLDVVQRGSTLFDRKNNTNVFEKDLKVNQTRLLEWEELPEAARRYVTLRASRVFQGRLVGSKELESLLARDEYVARAALMDFDGRTSDRTIFDSFDVASRIGLNRNYDLI